MPEPSVRQGRSSRARAAAAGRHAAARARCERQRCRGDWPGGEAAAAASQVRACHKGMRQLSLLPPLQLSRTPPRLEASARSRIVA
eukprot:6194650-Pleurochrysis_carterae.AAC.1